MNRQKRRRVGLWVRVSDESQTTENQTRQLTEWIEGRGWEITETYDLTGVSAFRNAHSKILTEAKTAARANRFDTLVVWALDRLSRGGAEVLLRHVREFSEFGCDVISYQEAFTETISTSPEMRDIFLAVYGWVANMESKKISERTKAGIERRRAEGKPIGRPKKGKKKGVKKS